MSVSAGAIIPTEAAIALLDRLPSRRLRDRVRIRGSNPVVQEQLERPFSIASIMRSDRPDRPAR